MVVMAQLYAFMRHFAPICQSCAINAHNIGWRRKDSSGSDNETGFRGTDAAPYRMEGWDFIIAGGGLYNNLDYSFVAGHEDGTFVYPASQPGGGPAWRRQLSA